MNHRLLATAMSGLAALLLAGCETSQGPSPSLGNQPIVETGKRIDPAPVSQSYAGKKDVFQGAEYDPGTGPLPAGAKQVRLRVGQVMEVYRGSNVPDGQREMAFYLPVEARSVVQLVVETRGLVKYYFLRAIGPGDTVGGVVERRWLSSDGFYPRDVAAEARVQDAVRAAPYLISVY